MEFPNSRENRAKYLKFALHRVLILSDEHLPLPQMEGYWKYPARNDLTADRFGHFIKTYA
jgi:hypothetical protein